ncbi:MAG: type II secretion system F family protein [Micrococcales bacterium]|nr:type II secretion system F family protein [Micrococcales bacterium]MCL2667109.1 type II secretion system F family protein [Micrococcales bacterium]
MTVLAALLLAVAFAPWTVRRTTPAPADTPPTPAAPDAVLLLALLDAAIGAGAPVPRALQAVGASVGGAVGDALATVGGRLTLGASWSEAVAAAPASLCDQLEPLGASWTSGAAPGPLLRQACDRLVRDRRDLTRVAAARLGVRLVLPLGLCLLPSFVLLGIVPVVLSLTGAFVNP